MNIYIIKNTVVLGIVAVVISIAMNINSKEIRTRYYDSKNASRFCGCIECHKNTISCHTDTHNIKTDIEEIKRIWLRSFHVSGTGERFNYCLSFFKKNRCLRCHRSYIIFDNVEYKNLFKTMEQNERV